MQIRSVSRSLAAPLLLFVAACSLAPQSEAEVIDRPGGDAGLSIESAPEAGDAGSTEDRMVEVTATVYFVSGEGALEPVARSVTAAPARDDQLVAVLRALVEGPADGEVEAGLRSVVPPATTVLGATIEDTTATLDLSSSFASIGGPEELLAVGQFVVTATTFPGVRELRLRLDGVPIDIPLPDGALTDQAVTLPQFSVLLAPR